MKLTTIIKKIVLHISASLLIIHQLSSTVLPIKQNIEVQFETSQDF